MVVSPQLIKSYSFWTCSLQKVHFDSLFVLLVYNMLGELLFWWSYEAISLCWWFLCSHGNVSQMDAMLAPCTEENEDSGRALWYCYFAGSDRFLQRILLLRRLRLWFAVRIRVICAVIIIVIYGRIIILLFCRRTWRVFFIILYVHRSASIIHAIIFLISIYRLYIYVNIHTEIDQILSDVMQNELFFGWFCVFLTHLFALCLFAYV